MSLYHRNLRAFNAAQSRWDNAAPPEDGPSPCEHCNGRGYISGAEAIDCEHCDGLGWFDEDGQPCRAPEGWA